MEKKFRRHFMFIHTFKKKKKKKQATKKQRAYCLYIHSSIMLFPPASAVVECLTRNLEAVGSSLTGVAALWSLSKTHLS